MIKPNVNELATLIVSLGLKENSIKEAVQEIVSKGYCEVVVVSLGAAGAIFCDKDTCTEIKAPPTKKMSTVGAGDSLVAGIVYSLMNNKDLLSAVSFGVACGSAATKNSGTELFYPQDARNLFQIMNGELMNSFVKV